MRESLKSNEIVSEIQKRVRFPATGQLRGYQKISGCNTSCSDYFWVLLLISIGTLET